MLGCNSHPVDRAAAVINLVRVSEMSWMREIDTIQWGCLQQNVTSVAPHRWKSICRAAVNLRHSRYINVLQVLLRWLLFSLVIGCLSGQSPDEPGRYHPFTFFYRKIPFTVSWTAMNWQLFWSYTCPRVTMTNPVERPFCLLPYLKKMAYAIFLLWPFTLDIDT